MVRLESHHSAHIICQFDGSTALGHLCDVLGQCFRRSSEDFVGRSQLSNLAGNPLFSVLI